jgi:hypothetical protein
MRLLQLTRIDADVNADASTSSTQPFPLRFVPLMLMMAVPILKPGAVCLQCWCAMYGDNSKHTTT